MPELPEVETVRKGLEKKANNFYIKGIEILRSSTIAFPHDHKVFIKGLNNSLIYKWDRKGKYLIASLKINRNISNPDNLNERFKNNGFLVIHLRMTGYFDWFVNPIEPCKHTRVRFFNEKKNELRFVDLRSFGQMWWVKEGLLPEMIIKGLGSLGPEPFSKDFSIEYLTKEFSKRTKSIKSTLLDQTIIAGIGNIYADESLFEAGISPIRESKSIKKREIIKLRESIINVLTKSIGSGGTTFSDFRDLEGSSGNYSNQSNVYRKTGKACNLCKTLIQRRKVSGRSTHWCPTCQK